MAPLIHILHLEDDPADAELIQAKIEEADLACRITRVQTRDEFDDALKRGGYDIILADYRLPMYDGMSALRLAQENCPEIPFIFVSGTMGEEAAIKGLTQGATDYVLKQGLMRLGAAVKRALQEARNRRERRKAQEALQRSNEMLRAIIEAAPVAIIGLDLEGRVHSVWNPTAEKMLGWSIQDAMGRPLPTVPVDGKEVYKRFREQIRSGRTLNGVEVCRQRRDGTPIDFSIYASPLHDAQGRISGNIAVLVDITERKRSEAVLKKTAAELEKHRDRLEELVTERTAELSEAKKQAEAALILAEEANATKSDFLARMSHEIRTPLNAVTGLTSIVLKSDLTIEQRDYLNKVQLASNNLLTVINDILDFSKVEAGRLELVHAPFDLDQLMEQLADLFSNRLAQKDLELIFSVASPLPRQLMGDVGRLTQVLTNLVENAVKFTETGEIVVGVEEEGGSKTAGQTVLKFSVRDTGIGIAPEMLPTLFDPFSQVDTSLTRKNEGTGLGLAICRRLVELMGGRIWADSTPGQGSTFAFTVLLEIRKEDEAKPTVSTPVDLRGLKALVVDDSASARQVLADLLESFAFEVTAVDSGEKALEELVRAAAGEPYQLVLLDWKMPGLDGIVTARRIRALGLQAQGSKVKVQDESAASRVPPPASIAKTPDQRSLTTDHRLPITISPPPIIILVTAYGHELLQARMDTSAADSLLLKPVKASQLFNIIMALFGRTEAAAVRIKAKRDAPHDQLAGRRVLVVEDSELNRDVTEALLTEAGLTVETAANGQIALDKVTGSPIGTYDGVLMDIQMPIMDGYQATRRIREWERRQPETTNQEPETKLPIIALTAHALTGERQKCLAAGMDDYLSKPIDEQHLERVLLKWIAPRPAQSPQPGVQKQTFETLHPPDPEQPEPVPGGGRIDAQGALKRLGGRKQVFVMALKKFKSDCASADITISQGLKAGDRQAVAHLAHKVKGTAGTIGAVGLAEASAKLEKAVSAKKVNLDELLKEFKGELTLALEGVATYLAGEAQSEAQGQEIDPVAFATDLGPAAFSGQPDDCLRQLAAYLEQGNMRAVSAWEQVKPLLLDRGHDQTLAEFEQNLDRLDFNGAVGLLAKIIGNR